MIIDGYKECSLKEAQYNMMDILDKVQEICEKNNIQYCLGDGSLLGAIRHRGFIPWDDDMDIWMLRDDFNKFISIAKKELGDKYFLQTIDSDKYYNLYHIPCKVRKKNTLCIEKNEIDEKYHKGMYIDVFPLDFIPNSSKLDYLKFYFYKFTIKFFRKLRNVTFLRGFIKKLLRKISKSAICNEKNKGNLVTYGVETFWNKEIRKMDLLPFKKLKFENREYYVPNNSEKILEVLYGDYLTLPSDEDRHKHSIYLGIRSE
ncbi:TPA: phosphorylcholine transferase LicD [Clostridium perfringens]